MADDADEIEELEALDAQEGDFAKPAPRPAKIGRSVLFASDFEGAGEISAFLRSKGFEVAEVCDVGQVPALLKEREFCAAIIDERGAISAEFAEKNLLEREIAKIVRIVGKNSRPDSQIPAVVLSNGADCLENLLSAVRLTAKNCALEGKIGEIRATMSGFLTNSDALFSFLMPDALAKTVLQCFAKVFGQTDGFIQAVSSEGDEEQKTIFAGIGRYDIPLRDFYDTVPIETKRLVVAAKTERATKFSECGVAMPLCGFNGAVFGVIFLAKSDFDDDIFCILSIFVRQAAVLINNSMMHKILDSQSEQLVRTNMQLNKSYLEVVQALREAVDAKDRYTHGHSERVAMYAVEIGRKMGLSEKSLEDLRVGGIFHDIGKIAVKDEILLKKSRLTDEEYEQIKIHPKKGGDILSGISMFRDVVPIVEGHHEHFDGKGYPRGLKGDEISQEARIMCAADAFDAMTSNREYHKKISFDEALARVMRARGTQFDPAVCDAFAELISQDRAKIQEISEFFGNED